MQQSDRVARSIPWLECMANYPACLTHGHAVLNRAVPTCSLSPLEQAADVQERSNLPCPAEPPIQRWLKQTGAH